MKQERVLTRYVGSPRPALRPVPAPWSPTPVQRRAGHLRAVPLPSADAAAQRFAAGRSRGTGPTTPLWHAVEIHRPVAEVDGACELSVCGVLARIVTGEPWPTAARDVCPICVALTR